MKGICIKNGCIMTPFKELKNNTIIIREGKIDNIIESNRINISDIENNYKVINCNGNFVSPGFIDIHTHGAAGEDCVQGDLNKIADFFVSHGITGFLATLIASPLEAIYSTFENIRSYQKNYKNTGAQIFGAHIEGLYLNYEKRGAQPASYIRKADLKECQEIIKKSQGILKIMTISPEIDGGIELVRVISDNGVIPSAGHSDASPCVIEDAVKSGLKHVTHVFNAMGRQPVIEPGTYNPGLEDIVLIKDELKTEIIADKKYVDPIMFKILVRCKGIDNIIIITDSMSVTGLPDGKYELDGYCLIVKDKIARTEDGGLSGSTNTMEKSIGKFIQYSGVEPKEAIQMATVNPARSLGIFDKKGSIEIGKDADIVIFNKNFDVLCTLINGNIVYENKATS